MPDVALQVVDLWSWYADKTYPALRGVNLSIPRGQFAAVVGANGSGKTTLIKHYNGLLRPKRGSVRVAGMDAAQQTIGQLARHVGFLFQHPEQQIFSSTVRREVAFGPSNLHLAPSEVQDRVDAALARFELQAVAGHTPAIMSYGVRRRVTLASLAAMDSPILVLDEPTVGLDRSGCEETIAWLRELHAQGRTIVLVTHDMALAAAFASRVIVLNEGQIVADEPPASLFREAQTLSLASLTPPPVVELAQRLHPRGFRGTPLSAEAFAEMYAAQLDARKGSIPHLDDDGERRSTSRSGPPAVDQEERQGSEGVVIEAALEAPARHRAAPPPGPATLALHIARDSWLHRLDPRSKLWAVLLAVVVGLLYRHIGLLAGLLVVAHLVLLSAKIPPDRIRWFWARLALLLIMILVLQPLFTPGTGQELLRLGPLRLTTTGLLAGVSFALRVAALAFVVGALLLTTEPTDLVQGLVKLGLPYPWGLTVGLSIRYMPTTYSLFVAISEAQQARGWIVGEGNLFRRARSYLPILVATIIAALRLSDQLGLALAARGLGYPARRTVIRDPQFRAADWVAVMIATLIFGILLYVRYDLRLGSAPW